MHTMYLLIEVHVSLFICAYISSRICIYLYYTYYIFTCICILIYISVLCIQYVHMYLFIEVHVPLFICAHICISMEVLSGKIFSPAWAVDKVSSSHGGVTGYALFLFENFSFCSNSSKTSTTARNP